MLFLSNKWGKKWAYFQGSKLAGLVAGQGNHFPSSRWYSPKHGQPTNQRHVFSRSTTFCCVTFPEFNRSISRKYEEKNLLDTIPPAKNLGVDRLAATHEFCLHTKNINFVSMDAGWMHPPVVDSLKFPLCGQQLKTEYSKMCWKTLQLSYVFSFLLS